MGRMNSLNDYIIERIRVDNIKLEEFPIDGAIKDMEEFLKGNGFEKIKNNYQFNGTRKYWKIFDEAYKKGYIIITEHGVADRIMFADTSKDGITTYNPMYYIEKDNGHFYEIRKISSTMNEYLTMDDLEKEMKSYFN